MDVPQELSVAEIRKYMLENDGKVTNHALVKYFKRFLTHPNTQTEARKQFKTYVNILATMKNENNQKFLVLRKRYINECPAEEAVQRAIDAAGNDSAPSSPGGISLTDAGIMNSPLSRMMPPPYKPPPEVNSPIVTGVKVQQENVENFRECVNEFAAAVRRNDPNRMVLPDSNESDELAKDNQVEKRAKSVSRLNSAEEAAAVACNKENIPRFSFSSGASGTSTTSNESSAAVEKADSDVPDNPISVKEATRKFNRMASEEEANKIISPPSKKKPEKQLAEYKDLLTHPKAKEWIVTMAKANYQEMAKLANDSPELVKLQDPFTGYTALHWAAKHGNEDVVKLIAGTYKADVNAKSNGGYTPLHLSIQFRRANIFELLCNVYKANRDLMDWSGNKPMDYSNHSTSVSASTFSKIKARRKHTVEKDLGFLRIGSLNVRVKKTTEAFSNFLGVGNGNGTPPSTQTGYTANHPHQRSHRHHHPHHRLHTGTTRNHHHHPRTIVPLVAEHRASMPINTKYEKIHKSWGSADNIPHNDLMPPPKTMGAITKRQKSSKRSSAASSYTTDSPRDSISSSNSSNLNAGYSSMPTTPNQQRTVLGNGSVGIDSLGDSDSDTACGFGSNWGDNRRSSLNNTNFGKHKMG